LSETTGLSRSAVFNRVKRLEKEGVITGYHAHVDRTKLGVEIRAFCNVSLQQHAAEYLKEFEQAIGAFSEVRTCFHIAGSFDYLIEVQVRDMQAYHTFISERLAALANIGKVESMFVMNEVVETRSPNAGLNC
jgi:DNA-binding Lrp family transcriptional regulator